MGLEKYYIAGCEGECKSCKKEMTLEARLSVYAYDWPFFKKKEKGCNLVEVLGFEDALNTFVKWARAAQHELPEDDLKSEGSGRSGRT
jgi:hypothetical protein